MSRFVLLLVLALSLKASAGIIFSGCEKSFTELIIPRPRWSTKPKVEDIDRYIRAYPKHYQPAVEHATKRLLVHVPQEEFEAALYRSVDKLMQKLPDGASVAVFDWKGVGGKSNEWVTQLALKHIHDHYRDISKHLKFKVVQDSRDLKKADIVLFFDDAVFSGVQMVYEVVKPHLPEHKDYAVVVPFYTNDSLDHLDSSHLITDTEMQTYGSKKNAPFWFTIFEKEIGVGTLTIFDHLKPDSASTLKMFDPTKSRGGSDYTLINGDVLGTSGWTRREFIPEPDKPYRREQ
jgi:hypothetical protein